MNAAGLQLHSVKPGWVYIEVLTADGATGIGEAFVSGSLDALAAATRHAASLIKGRDLSAIHDVLLHLSPHTSTVDGIIPHPVLCAIEMALWDLKGKAAGLPLYSLWGGSAHRKHRLVASCHGANAGDTAAAAKAMRLKGFNVLRVPLDQPDLVISPRMLKLNADRVAAVREASGPNIDIIVDFRGRMDVSSAIRMAAALEPVQPLCIESPCTPETPETLSLVSHATAIPVAAGRNWPGTRLALEAMRASAIRIIQPNLCSGAGISSAINIAGCAHELGMLVIPAPARGPVSLAATLHFAAAIPNCICVEYPAMPNLWDIGHGFFTQPITTEGGGAIPPSGPGLGITLRDEVVTERRNEQDLQPPEG